MIYFIYGAAGSGKTTTLFDYVSKDVESGQKAVILVPEQETVAVERRVLTDFPASAQLTLEVLNFSRLCNKIFRTYGSLSYDVADKGIKSLLMWNNLRELSPLLEEYRFSDVTDFSLTEKMISAVGELKAYNVSPLKFEASCEKIPHDSSLYSKARDISLIYSAYVNKLSESFSDSSDDISIALNLLKNNNFFSGVNVYIDSFAGYTEQEFLMLSRIFELAENAYITIGMPSPDDPSIHFESLRNTAKKLKKLIDGKKHKEIILGENKRAQSADLKYLCENIWRFDAKRASVDSTQRSIFPYLCESPYSEAEIVSCEISRAIREGIKYGEIAIIARDTEAYRGILDIALQRYNIPYFISEKTDLMTKPLAKYIFSALKIKESGWKLQNVISHLKTGLSDIEPDDIDLFDDYTATWNINGSRFFEETWTMNPDGYSSTLTERGKRILSVANSVKDRLVPPLARYFAKLDASENVSEMCRATVDFLNEAHVTDKVRTLYSKNMDLGNKKAAAEDLQLYNIMLEILYKMSSILGEEKLNFAEFSAALSLMFVESDIGTIPTAADEVIIGSASMLRASNVKIAILIGANEGEFPAAVKDSGIFTDSDKEILSSLDIELSSNSNIKAAEELYFVYRSICSSSSRLILTTTASSSNGRSKRPSVIFDRIEQLLGYKTINENTISPADRIWSYESAAQYYSKIKGTQDGVAAEQILLADNKRADSILHNDTPISQKDCTVSKDIADRIFGTRMNMSHSRLEKYVRCGFDYYCNYVLKLRENKKAVFQLNDIGSFVHAILERFMREIRVDGKLDLSLSNEEIHTILERSVNTYLVELLGEKYAVSNRTKHLFARLNKLSLLLVKNILKEFKDSSFYPAYFELPIGFSGEDKIEALEFTLNDGSTVALRGFVDRVDLYSQGGDVYVRVVDYKTGSKEFSLSDVKEGLNMQLLLYLFTICKTNNAKIKKEFGCAEDGSVLPAGIQYLSSNIKTVSLDEFLPDDEVSLRVESELNRSGLFLDDMDVLTAINQKLDPSILNGIKVKDGVAQGKNLASRETFDMIFNELSQTVIRVAQSMKDGAADASPLVRSGSSPCNYCKMNAICRSAQKTTY